MFSKIKKLFSASPVDNRTEEEKEFMEITKQIKSRLFCIKKYDEGCISLKINDLFNSYSKPPYDGYCGYFEAFNDKRAILEIISLIFPVHDDIIENRKDAITDIIKSGRNPHLERNSVQEIMKEKEKDWGDFAKLMSDTPLMSFSNFRHIYRGDTESTARHLLTLEDLKIKERHPVDIERFIEMVEAGEHLKFQ